MRTVFMGTPEIAVPALRALAASTELVAVVCQPDRPRGRGLALAAPAVKLAAQQLGIEVCQPVKVKGGELERLLLERAPEVAVVLAYGRLLPPGVLAAPRRGCVNLHASLLPRYRGAAPIQWAIVRGETETGVSLMQMEEGLDTGPVFCARRLAIGPEETAGELGERIATLCATVVLEDLPRVLSGELAAQPQDHTAATHAPPIRREDCRIDWTRTAREVVDLVRGMAPRPGAHTTLRGRQLRVARAGTSTQPGVGPAGTVSLGIGRELLVQTAAGAVEIGRAQMEGRKELDAADLLNGRALVAGDRFD